MTTKYFISLLIVAALTSCNDVVQVKIDQGDRLLVVDAFIDDQRSTQKVRLTYTDDFFNGQDPPGVKGATVVLKDLSNNKTYNFTDNNNGDYYFNIATTDTIGYVGHNYQLEVAYGSDKFTSNAYLARSTPIDSISATFLEKNSFTDEGYFCILWAVDIPGPVSDYVWVKSFRNGKLYNKGNQINLSFDGAYSNGNDGMIFIPPIAQNITQFNELFQKNDVNKVELHSISKECYNFLLQVQIQTTNSGLFATTPENIKSNINTPTGSKLKAIGWFNMAAVSSASKLVQ